jgi:hypothetical protein
MLMIHQMNDYGFLIEDFDDVLATVSFFINKNPSAKFWTTYQERR